MIAEVYLMDASIIKNLGTHHLRSGRGRKFAARYLALAAFAAALLVCLGVAALAQRTSSTSGTKGFIISGDIRIDESHASEPGPTVIDVILYTSGRQVFARQRVTPNGRYRFLDVFAGDYIVVLEVENQEVARASVLISAKSPVETNQDFSLEWRATGGKPAHGVVGVGDAYDRSPANKALYAKAEKEIAAKNFKEAISILTQLTAADPRDFPALNDLGMLYFLQKNYEAAEKSYTNCLSAKPDHFPALLSLGRVQIARANYQAASATLESAVKLDPRSPAANYFLGEAYLQLKKGSKAVGFLNEALALDPVGMADAHLRLGALYNGANLKDRAAAEYEAFLKVKPDYAERKKLEEYITANKKP